MNVRPVLYDEDVQASPVLFVVGVLAEFVGIVLLGFPDLVPGAVRLSAWLRQQENRLRRRIGREPRNVVVTVGAATASAAFGGRAAGIVGTSETTLEGQVAYLLRRDQDAQREGNALAARVSALEAELPRQRDEAQRQMEHHVAGALAAARAEYRELRLAGTFALFAGLACVTVATLIG
jgi:hypothetical protein